MSWTEARVVINGVVLTNALTGTNGIPALHNNVGAWVNADIRLRRGGLDKRKF